jgi:hypothetical protein
MKRLSAAREAAHIAEVTTAEKPGFPANSFPGGHYSLRRCERQIKKPAKRPAFSRAGFLRR